MRAGDFVLLQSKEFMLVKDIFQHSLPSGLRCVWLRGRPLVATDLVCFVPGKELFKLSYSATKIVPAFEAAALTHFFHHWIHRPDRFRRCCIGAELNQWSVRAPLVRSNSAICEVVDVACCVAHLLSEPCPKSSRVYQCNLAGNPFYYHEHWYSYSLQR